MIGKIIGIEGNTVLVNLSINLEETKNIINLYVLFDDGDKKYVGEIADIKNNTAYINLIGELINNSFTYGISKKPSFKSIPQLIREDKINYVIGMSDYTERKYLYMGKSPIYDQVDIGVNINNFFSNHFAIFGSSGSGKSCSVARIIQNLYEKQQSIAYNSSLLIFDAYGEYHQAFETINTKCSDINFKAYTTNVKDDKTPIVKIPLWILTVDDMALLLDAKKRTDLPIIEKAMKLVTIFAKEEQEVIKIKNDIIARALLDVLSSGKNSSQIRDQVFSILAHYYTKDLNLETQIVQPGYIRTLKQCLLVDASGKITEMELLTNFMNSFLLENVDLFLPDGTFKYTLKDLYNAFEFALISEGIFSSDKVFDDYNTIKVNLRNLMNGDYAKYFDVEEYIDLDNFIKSILLTSDGKKAQLINFNINYVDDRFAKTLTKIYSKIFFEYTKNLKERASLPINIILEEAHRYVQNDTDIDIIGYNIFDRIAKEGRKYGTMLGLISQRPSELSTTALSQCNNFLIFKILHPTDVDFVKQMVPNITEEIIKKMKYLQPGNCIAFGSGFKLPSLIRFDMPDPSPSSSNCDVSKIWFIDRN